MKRGLQLMLLAALAVVVSSSAWAQSQPKLPRNTQFVYVNDDINGSNTVEGFKVTTTNGAATALAGSPYSTGGSGIGGGFYVTPRVAAQHNGGFLYVVNAGSSTISIFSINYSTGVPTLVSSSTSTGGSCTTYGCGIAFTPNGKFAYIANGDSDNVTAFTVNTNTGALTMVSGGTYSTKYLVDGIATTPDGNYVVATEPQTSASSTHGAIYVWSINQSTGALTAATGSPTTGKSYVAGITINCASSAVYLGDATGSGWEVEGYGIGSGGKLTALPGSPYTGFDVVASNGVQLSRGAKYLFVSNQDSASVQSFTVNSDGSITEIAPYAIFGSAFTDFPAGMSINPLGNLLFVGEYTFGTPSLWVARVNNNNGSLSLGANSPVALAASSAPLSVDAFPALVCTAN